MRIIRDATKYMLTEERVEHCYGCGSDYAFLLDDVTPVRRMDFFMFIPTGYIYDAYYVECPVCKQKAYQWRELNTEERRYLIRKDKEKRLKDAQKSGLDVDY